MANPGLSDDVCRGTAKLYNDAKGNIWSASELSGIPEATFRKRVQQSKKRFPTLFKEWPISTGGLKAQPRTLEQDVEAHRARESEASARAKLKDATAHIADLEQRIKDLEWGAKGDYSPAVWTLPNHPKRKREHMPYLLTSDAQLGEVIDPSETEYGVGYNKDIYVRRHRRIIDTTIYLSVQHSGKEWVYPGIIYVRAGDTISGGIHEELRDTDDLTPIEACELAFEEEAAGIEKLAEAFGKVEVKAPGAAGNHDRTTLKPRTKKASAHSYDRLISFMLRKHFRNDKRVTFQVSNSFDVYFNIYDMKILVTHGDRTGSKGGQGFVGPGAVVLRGAQKVMMEQSAIGRHVDRVDHGHLHFPMYLPHVLSNGCYPGYSEYAKSHRMRPQPPQQFLLYHHPRRGCVDIKPIILTEA